MNLQAHEVRLLKDLENGKEKAVDEIVKSSGLDQVAVMRGAQVLSKKGLATIAEEQKITASLTKEGKEALSSGLPEKQLLREIGKGKDMKAIKLATKNIAIGFCRKKGFIEMDKTSKGVMVKPTSAGTKFAKETSAEEKALKDISDDNKPDMGSLTELKSRGLAKMDVKTLRRVKLTTSGMKEAKKATVVEEVSRLTPELIRDHKWKDVSFRRYNLKADVKPIFPGKIHPVRRIIEKVRDIFIEMGFQEARGPLAVSSLWNFDALYQPQDHPARELADTFYLKTPEKAELPKKDAMIDRIQAAHENGGDTGSTGWGYKWSKDFASRMVLRTHTTAVSSKKLTEVELPAKVFCVDRAFRNETLDYKHLMELHQVEGIVVDPNVTFRDLIGYLKEFFAKLGFEKIQVRPAYFPYTEMSTEIEIWHPVKQDWMELGGAGIFRPEVVKPLLGKDVPVLAWGIGLDRLVMDIYGVNDVRELYKNDLSWLREMPIKTR